MSIPQIHNPEGEPGSNPSFIKIGTNTDLGNITVCLESARFEVFDGYSHMNHLVIVEDESGKEYELLPSQLNKGEAALLIESGVRIKKRATPPSQEAVEAYDEMFLGSAQISFLDEPFLTADEIENEKRSLGIVEDITKSLGNAGLSILKRGARTVLPNVLIPKRENTPPLSQARIVEDEDWLGYYLDYGSSEPTAQD